MTGQMGNCFKEIADKLSGEGTYASLLVMPFPIKLSEWREGSDGKELAMLYLILSSSLL